MMRINYEASDYERIEDVKKLVDSLDSLFDKFNSDFNDRYEPLQKAEKDIEDKKKEIESYSETVSDSTKKIEELERLRDKTKSDIDSLTEKKKEVSYTDSEVQKMEEEDIDAEISSKTEKIAKIETKLLNTQEKLEINKFNREDAEKELDGIISYKHHQESFIKKTEEILDLVSATKEKFAEDIARILESSASDISSDVEKESISIPEVTETLEPVIEKEPEIEYPKIDFDLKEIELDYDKDDYEEIPLTNEETETTDDIELESKPTIDDSKKEDAQNVSSLKDVFESEGIKYEEFLPEARSAFEQNTERVKENISVLKRHNIPLELTFNQYSIYYKKDAKELDELLKIITTDEDGNGMGFTIDFVYYILDELASIDIDKLINVYNNEFMRVDAKTGLIELLKKTDEQIGTFENNKNANVEILTDLGVTTTQAIETTYPEFLALDNPLFLNALNLFDKEDLVEKLNDEIKIVPKIMAYWRSN